MVSRYDFDGVDWPLGGDVDIVKHEGEWIAEYVSLADVEKIERMMAEGYEPKPLSGTHGNWSLLMVKKVDN